MATVYPVSFIITGINIILIKKKCSETQITLKITLRTTLSKIKIFLGVFSEIIKLKMKQLLKLRTINKCAQQKKVNNKCQRHFER